MNDKLNEFQKALDEKILKDMHTVIVPASFNASDLDETIDFRVAVEEFNSEQADYVYKRAVEFSQETPFQKIASTLASPFDSLPGTILTDFIGDKMGISKFSKYKDMHTNLAEKNGTTYNYTREEHNNHRHNDTLQSSLKTIGQKIYDKGQNERLVKASKHHRPSIF